MFKNDSEITQHNDPDQSLKLTYRELLLYSELYLICNKNTYATTEKYLSTNIKTTRKSYAAAVIKYRNNLVDSDPLNLISNTKI